MMESDAQNPAAGKSNIKNAIDKTPFIVYSINNCSRNRQLLIVRQQRR